MRIPLPERLLGATLLCLLAACSKEQSPGATPAAAAGAPPAGGPTRASIALSRNDIMARAVVGGLITSTLLTLFVVPVMYTLLDDATALVLRRRTVPEPTVEPAAGD